MQPIEKNARFWTYVNGWTKITLRPGETFNHCIAHPTDEGWSAETHRWTHEGDRIVEELSTDGVDCDGRLSRTYSYFAAVGDLRPFVEEDGILYMQPNWQVERSSQRDYSAEAAGY